MDAEINGIALTNRKGLWFGDVPSKAYGSLEAVLDGSKEAPNAMQAEALRRFTANIDANVNKLRRRLMLPFLFRPVRLAPFCPTHISVNRSRSNHPPPPERGEYHSFSYSHLTSTRAALRWIG